VSLCVGGNGGEKRLTPMNKVAGVNEFFTEIRVGGQRGGGA